MSENYSNNQFYNWKTYESLNPASRTSKDNPAFLWPSDKRTLANVGDGRPVKQKIQRGYMRMLSESLGRNSANQAIKNLGAHRLFFQFNPDTITRSVAARNDVQYWMNMDPIQLTQPIPGDQNFAFELLFNREAEVASGIVANRSTYERGGISRLVETEGLAIMRDPSQVGVLADLYQFDRIIGQGINREVIDAYLANAALLREKERQEQEKKKSSDTGDEEDQEEAIEPLSDEDRGLIRDNLSINVGNSAFLVANPIRIIFSSLFMVEGYVTQTQVVFNKFNQDMVPTQCVVNLSMQALYIGAAKKDTFLTLNGPKLDDLDEASAEQEKQEAKEMTFLKDFADRGFKNVVKQTNAQAVRGAYALLGDKGTRQLAFKMQVSDELKNVIKQAQVDSITASASWKVTYINNTNSKPASTYDYGKTWTSESSLDMKLNNLEDLYYLSFDRPSLTQGILLDTTSTSVYLLEVVISFTYVTPNGVSYTSKQKVKWTSQTTWSPSITTPTAKTHFSIFYTLSNG